MTIYQILEPASDPHPLPVIFSATCQPLSGTECLSGLARLPIPTTPPSLGYNACV